MEYERWGDDPRFPGELVKATVTPEGRGGSPDFSFVFSSMTMREFVRAGIKIQDKAEELGHKIEKPFRLGGAARLGIAAFPIVGLIFVIALCLFALWPIWWLFYGDDPKMEAFLDSVNEAVEKGQMTEEEAAEAIAEYNKQNGFYDGMFGPVKEALNIFVIVGIAAVAVPLIGYVTGWFDY